MLETAIVAGLLPDHLASEREAVRQNPVLQSVLLENFSRWQLQVLGDADSYFVFKNHFAERGANA